MQQVCYIVTVKLHQVWKLFLVDMVYTYKRISLVSCSSRNSVYWGSERYIVKYFLSSMLLVCNPTLFCASVLPDLDLHCRLVSFLPLHIVSLFFFDFLCLGIQLDYAHGHVTFSACFPFWQTTALKNGSLRHDIHYWIGKDTSQVNISYHWWYCFGKAIESNFVHVRTKLELLRF